MLWVVLDTIEWNNAWSRTFADALDRARKDSSRRRGGSSSSVVEQWEAHLQTKEQHNAIFLAALKHPEHFPHFEQIVKDTEDTLALVQLDTGDENMLQEMVRMWYEHLF